MIGVDTLDRTILRAIVREPKSATDIGDMLGKSRTTVAYRLRRLKRQRLVRMTRGSRRRILWSQEMARNGRARVMVFEGDNFAQVPLALKTLRKGSTVYNVIGTAALRLNFKNTSEAVIIESQRLIKRRRLVIKVIMHEEGLAVTRGLSNVLLKAHSDRSLALKGFVSRAVFSGAGEVVAARSFVVIYNSKNKRSIFIRDRQMVALVYEVVALLFDTFETATPSRVFDFQKHINSILAERARSHTVEE